MPLWFLSESFVYILFRLHIGVATAICNPKPSEAVKLSQNEIMQPGNPRA